MNIAASTTYIIPNPEVIRPHYLRSLNNEDKAKNKVSRENANNAFMVFLKAAAAFHQKGWSFEWVKSHGGSDLKVNGHNVWYKFSEKWILIENGGSNSRYIQSFRKQSTQIHYDKALTLKDHGKKVIDVIESAIIYNEKQRADAINKENNAHLSMHAMKYLVTRHGFSMRERDYNDGEGYWPSSSEYAISMSRKFDRASCVFTFSTATEDFGKITMTLKDTDYLNLKGTYALGGLATKYAEMQDMVNILENEFRKIVKLWPEAVAYVKENGNGD